MIVGASWISTHVFFVRGDSMIPCLFHNDLIIVNEKDSETIAIGDVVMLKSLSEYVDNGGIIFSDPSHRVVHQIYDKKKVNETWYFSTRGINNKGLIDGTTKIINESEGYILYEHNASNPVYISENSILGVMVFKISFIGNILEVISLSTFIIIISILIKNGIRYILQKMNRRIIKNRSEGRWKNSLAMIFLEIFIIGLIVLQLTIPIIQNAYFMNNESLQPELSEGDFLIAPQVDPSEIQIGDCVIIESASYYYDRGFDFIWWQYPTGKYFIHRIHDKFEINGSWHFSTYGDNSFQPIDGLMRTLDKTGSDNYSYFLFEYNISNPIYIPEEAILGVVSYKIPLIGQIYSINGILLILLVILFTGVLFCKIRGIKFQIIEITTNQ